MISQIKSMLVCWLPRSFQHRIRQWYYLRLVKNFREEQWTSSAGVRRLIQPGDRVVDAGANIGYTTWLLARWVGPGGQVLAIEPIPATFDLLSHSLRRLGAGNVRLFPCALSDRDGAAVADIPPYGWGGENFYESRILAETGAPAHGHRRVPVALRRLDGLVPDDGMKVSFIKLDVEGHEWPAVQGASAILERNRPAWFIEVSGNPEADGSSAHRLFRLMESYGYGAYVFEDQEFRLRRPGEKQVDYFFLTADHLKKLPTSR